MHFTRVGAEAFTACPDDSIDYAVMEKTDSAVVMPLDAGWNDIGAWSALWDGAEKDHNRNACKGDIITYDSRNNYLHTEHRLIAAIGIDDLIFVETKDATLVAHRNKVQDVKKIVEQIK